MADFYLVTTNLFSLNLFFSAARYSALVATLPFENGDLAQKLLFGSTQFFAMQLAEKTRIRDIFCIPSWVVFSLSRGNQKNFGRTRFIASIIGIISSTLFYLRLISVVSSSVVKGFLIGMHASGMMFFAYAPIGVSMFGLITFRDSFRLVVIPKRIEDRCVEKLGEHTVAKLSAIAEVIASIALVLFKGIGLFFIRNCIAADSIGYTAAALVKILAERILIEIRCIGIVSKPT